MIVLAAPRTERIHQQERAAVRNSRRVILRIAQDHIRCGKVPERFEIRHHRRGVRIEGDCFALVAPKWIAGDLEKDFVRKHLLDKSARLGGLARIDKSFAAVFIAAEHAGKKQEAVV